MRPVGQNRARRYFSRVRQVATAWAMFLSAIVGLFSPRSMPARGLYVLLALIFFLF